MQKESQVKLANLLEQTGELLVQAVEERDAALAKVAAYELRERTTKLAASMHEKGIEVDVPVDKLAEHLTALADTGKLAEYERAVELVGPDMGSKVGSLGGRSSTGLDPLTSLLING